MIIPFLNDWKVVKSKLSTGFCDTRTKWWLSNKTFAPLAKSTTDAVRDILEDVIPPHVEILKRAVFELTERKIIFRITHPESSEKFFIVKVFLGDRRNLTADGKHKTTVRIKLRYRLRSSIYSLNEVARLFRARDKGINTPKVYGYGHIYGLLRLVDASVIIMEDLHDLSPIKKLLLKGTDNERHQIFMRTIPLFVSLYNAGCNHINVNSGAIMLCEHNLNPNVFLLDFQHAKFHSKPSSEILMFEAGHFAHSCRNLVSTETVNEWFDKLLMAVNINHTKEIQEMKERFYYYCKAKLSRKHRKKLI